MGIVVRQRAAADREAVERMLAESGAFSPAECAVALELLDQSLASEGGDYPHLVAEIDGEAAGYVCIGPTPMTQSTWHLYWICVRPAMQRRGIGRKLHALAEQFITQRSGRRIVLETSGRPDYSGSRQFYLTIGYQVAGEIRDYYGAGDSCLYYCKEL